MTDTQRSARRDGTPFDRAIRREREKQLARAACRRYYQRHRDQILAHAKRAYEQRCAATDREVLRAEWRQAKRQQREGARS